MWDWLFQFIEPLEQANIPYALVGSVGSSIYGEPRATNDLDLVVQIKAADAKKILDVFPAEKFYVPPLEVMLAELDRGRGAHLNIIALDSMTKADLYPLPEEQRSWFERRRSLEVTAGRKLWVAAPEAIILHKLLFHRESGGEKHLRDVRAMRAVLGEKLDLAWLEQEAARMGISLPKD